MLNQYPWWKNLLILSAVLIGFIYAMPNLYAPDPAVQITGESSTVVIDKRVMNRALKALDDAGIDYFGDEIGDGKALVRVASQELQLRAKSVIQLAVGDGYIVALNLAPTTPDWLTSIGASPMKYGLDLSGGVHFLLEVDTQVVVERRLNTYLNDFKSALRKARVRGIITLQGDAITGSFNTAEARDAALDILRTEYRVLQRRPEDTDDKFLLTARIPESEIKLIEDSAVSQNLTTLRNRVNEIGVAEPLVQRQGRNRIIVQLPGIQDTAAAKRIIGKTANLEFRLEARPDAAATERERFDFKGGARRPAMLEKRIIISGERVSDARASFDENGLPQVNISLDSEGGTLMHRATRDKINTRLGVLFIERKSRTVGTTLDDNGHTVAVKEDYDVKEIISLATIRAALGNQFRVTGLDSPGESSELALLLRAGALAAPVKFAEERTVGPSLGAENIALGVKSVQIGLALVLIFMLLYYRVFGLVANLALSVNLVMLVACMSILSATLTLPGIAGIVLTVGMAVDANVLIFSRIREELKNGLSPQQAINAGYERAFVTIIDANITTLIVAVILYAVGTGSVKGFAVTLFIGILTSMFTAILGSRAIINLVYGGRNIKKIWI